MVAKAKIAVSLLFITLVIALLPVLSVSAQSSYGEGSFGDCDYSANECEGSGDLSNTGQESLYYMIGGGVLLASALLLYFVGKKSKKTKTPR